MNRNLILITIAAVAIVGIGIGLLLPNLQDGTLTGSIVPNWTTRPVTLMRTTAPTPALPNVSITLTGTYVPYKRPIDQLGHYNWVWRLYSVAEYDATRLPPGVYVDTVHHGVTGTRIRDGTIIPCDSTYLTSSQPLPATDSHTIDDQNDDVGCYVEDDDFCPSSEWIIGPPFVATCTVWTSDGAVYTESIEVKSLMEQIFDH